MFYAGKGQKQKNTQCLLQWLTTRNIALEKGTDNINDGLPLYLGHVLGIWHNKHPWRRFFIDGHDVPVETEMVCLIKTKKIPAIRREELF